MSSPACDRTVGRPGKPITRLVGLILLGLACLPAVAQMPTDDGRVVMSADLADTTSAPARAATPRRHWLEGKWEVRGFPAVSSSDPMSLTIESTADGTLTVIETAKSDQWNLPYATEAKLQIDGDKATITDDLGNVFDLKRVGDDELSGRFFLFRYQTHNIKIFPVTCIRMP